MTPLKLILTKLPSATGPNASGWYGALCPTHDDHRRSLGIKAGDTGAVIVKCQAACTTASVVGALGLTMKDLFPAPNGQGARIAATYSYHDETGALLFEVVRLTPKAFRQRRPDGSGGWRWKLDGVQRVLYRLPAILAADPTTTIYIVEGEKDADRLTALGLVATTNPGGAGKWRREYTTVLRDRHVVIVPDNDEAGRNHAEEVRRALDGIAASVRVVALPGLPPKGDVSDWLAAGGTRDQLEALARAEDSVRAEQAVTPDACGPWARAVTAVEFLAGDDPTLDWLVPRLLSPGSLTYFFSPRGLGKTHVSYAYAVALARAGNAVLLLDRDNARREIRRRLRAWGAADLESLHVMTRDDVPPLTAAAAWAAFPFGSYDLVIVDSLDAATEGVGEQDSARPSRAIAPLLDLAHRANGPAILVLANTIKSGSHGRGSGVVEDRGDIIYEVRDATDFTASGTKPWWEELPPAGRDAWAQRATRRKQRQRYVLAFISSKFRVGIEPDPFALEIDLSTVPWSIRDVTAEIEQAGEAEQVAAEQAVITSLVAEIDRRAATETPFTLSLAVAWLVKKGMKRNAARALLDRGAGKHWRLVEDTSQKGHPTFVVGVNQEWLREKNPEPAIRTSRDGEDTLFSHPCAASAGDKAGVETVGREGSPDADSSPTLSPATPGGDRPMASALAGLTAKEREQLEAEAAASDPLAVLIQDFGRGGDEQEDA